MAQTSFHTHAVRRLYRPDLPLFRDHLTRLDEDTRYNRFGLQVSDAYLAEYVDLCFRPDAITYGYFEDGVIRGAAELRVFTADDVRLRRSAEAAFSVEKPWRRRGIGTELMSHVVLAARNRRVTEITIFCLQSNQAMLRLARKFETDLTFERNDVTGHLVARAPSPVSYVREILDNVLDLGSAVLEFQGRLIRSATARSN